MTISIDFLNLEDQKCEAMLITGPILLQRGLHALCRKQKAHPSSDMFILQSCEIKVKVMSGKLTILFWEQHATFFHACFRNIASWAPLKFLQRRIYVKILFELLNLSNSLWHVYFSKFLIMWHVVVRNLIISSISWCHWLGYPNVVISISFFYSSFEILYHSSYDVLSSGRK